MLIVQSIADEEALLMKSLVNVQSMLNALFTTAVKRTYPFVTKTDNLIHPSNQAKFGDYKFVATMQIAQVCVCVCVYACMSHVYMLVRTSLRVCCVYVCMYVCHMCTWPCSVLSSTLV